MDVIDFSRNKYFLVIGVEVHFFVVVNNNNNINVNHT